MVYQAGSVSAAQSAAQTGREQRSLTIRDAGRHDALAVAQMANSLARVTRAGDGLMTAEKVERDLIIRGRGLELIVGEVDGSVQGYALYSVAYETANAARGLYLSDLYTARPARRRGLARAMMSELARRCRDNGGEFMWWMVMPGNPVAEAFYANLGAVSDPPKAMEIHGAAFQTLVRS